MLDDIKGHANRTVYNRPSIDESVEITFDFHGMTAEDRNKRINGFSVRNCDDMYSRDPDEVTVSWAEDGLHTQSLTFALDFNDKGWTELYFDLPKIDVEEFKFEFQNKKDTWM